MIKILESDPTKLSGLSSLYITFNYKREIIDIIKSLDKYSYNPKDYSWEIPITNLAYLLDEFVYWDDVTLQLKKDETNSVHYYPKCQSQYKSKPFDHQMEAIEYALNVDNWLLLDDPGLGKTLQVIYSALELKEQKGLKHCLIICGINSLKATWESEIHKHSNLSCRILAKKVNSKGKVSYGSIKERVQELSNPIEEFFIITNIESIRSEEVLDALKKNVNDIGMCVVDECHKIKNPSSQQGHNLLKLKDYQFKIGLTGTLIMNKPLDAFTALKWIGAEKATLTNFKGQYCVYGGFGGHQIVGYHNLDILKQEIDSCSLRRTKDMIKDLPPKTVINEMLEMDDVHRQFYQAIKDGVKEEADKINLNPNNVLAMTTRLMQATACPSILTTESIQSTKISRAVDLVEEIVAAGNKVVIMCTYKEPLNELYELLKEYNPLLGSGDVTDDAFNRNVELFQKDPKYKVFLGTVSKAGTGITLNAASYMICINTPWTAAIQRQVEDRIHRINNTEPVFIYKLICKDTIDEHIENIIQTKQAFSDFIVDDKVDSNSINLLRQYIEELR